MTTLQFTSLLSGLSTFVVGLAFFHMSNLDDKGRLSGRCIWGIFVTVLGFFSLVIVLGFILEVSATTLTIAILVSALAFTAYFVWSWFKRRGFQAELAQRKDEQGKRMAKMDEEHKERMRKFRGQEEGDNTDEI